LKGIAFTFDDDVSTHHEIIAPMFEKYGISCTFFINGSNLNLWRGIHGYQVSDMTDEQIVDLYKRGFEIGNHTFNHIHIAESTLPEIRDNFLKTEDKLSSLGVEVAPVFSYPGYVINKSREEIRGALTELGYKLGRIGYFEKAPGYDHHLDNNPQTWERDESHYYKPKETDPFFVKCCAMFCDNLSFDLFKSAVENAPEDSFCITNGHVFARDYEIEKLEKICKFIKDNDIKTVHFSDLPA